MPLFEYKAVTATGQIVNDIFEAPNEQAVSREIFKKGYKPISIKASKKGVVKEAKGGPSFFQKKIKTTEIVLFTKEMVTLLRAGVPMLTALEILGTQAGKEMGVILKKIYVDVMSGRSFSQALGRHPRIF